MPEPQVAEGVPGFVVQVPVPGQVPGLDQQAVEPGTRCGVGELLTHMFHPSVQALARATAPLVELDEGEQQRGRAGSVELPLAGDPDAPGALRRAGLRLYGHVGELEVLVGARGAGPRLDGLGLGQLGEQDISQHQQLSIEATTRLGAQPVPADGTEEVLPPAEPFHGCGQGLGSVRGGLRDVGDVSDERVEHLAEVVGGQDHLEFVLKARHGTQVHLDPGSPGQTPDGAHDRVRGARISPKDQHALSCGVGDGEEDVELRLRVQAEAGPPWDSLRALQLVPLVLGDGHASSSSSSIV